MAVTILNVEPGAYRPWVARFKSGAPGRVLRWAKFCSTLVGLKLGVEYIATTRPVLGSIATTAPVRPARPFCAALCAGTDRLVMTLSPVTVSPRNVEPRLEMTVARSEFEAVRYGFSASSRAVRPSPTVLYPTACANSGPNG